MKRLFFMFVAVMALMAGPALADSHHAKNPCGGNPCAHNPCTKNPCGGNPCARNPCAANPCGGNPCAANPCGGNPCGKSDKKPIRSERITDSKALLKRGKALWANEKLGTSGLACNTCHMDHENLNLDKKQSWPHYVAMTKDIVTLDQMINFCMLNPMAGKQLDANSVDMTAMSAWYQEYAKSYKGK